MAMVLTWTLQGHGLEDLHNLLNHLWMPDTYIANARSCLALQNVWILFGG